MPTPKIRPDLSGVPETMLWTLYNRASEARKINGYIRDPEAIRICDAIEYDYKRSFGLADGSHACRSAEIDVVLKPWLADHPGGWVVALGEGLETQLSRVDNGTLTWLTVDLPEAMRFRERFLPARSRNPHFAGSALDRAWMDLVPAALPGSEVCIIAQGLFMYLPPDEVRRLMHDLAARFPGGWLIFDNVPRWLARLTLRPQGLMRTKHYRIPPMPWGIDTHEIAPLLRDWGVSTKTRTQAYYQPHGVPWLVSSVMRLVPGWRERVPAITRAVLQSC